MFTKKSFNNQKNSFLPLLLLLITLAFGFSIAPPSSSAASACKLSLSDGLSTTALAPTAAQTHTFVVRNVGTSPCQSASLSVFYGANESFVKAVPTPSARTNYYWHIGRLNRSQSATITVTTKLADPKNTESFATEACAAANNASDACTYSTTKVLASAPAPTPVPPPATPPVSTPPSTPPTSTGSAKEHGVWVWDSALSMTAAKERSVIDAAAANSFNVIYITIDDYLEVHAMPAGSAKTAAFTAYSDDLYGFISYAHSKGVAIDVEAGHKDWGKPENRWKAYAIYDFATAFNATHDRKIRNVQYDVEPYLLPEYEGDKAPVLTDYVGLVYGLAAKTPGSSAGLSFAIPHFFDSAQAWTPSVTYSGKTASTFTHLLMALNGEEGNTLNIMAYRDYAEGAGGTIDISEEEVAEAAGYKTKVIVGQETGNVPPDYVTFFGQPKSALMRELGIIQSSFTGKAGYGGTSVHYLDPFLVLR